LTAGSKAPGAVLAERAPDVSDFDRRLLGLDDLGGAKAFERSIDEDPIMIPDPAKLRRAPQTRTCVTGFRAFGRAQGLWLVSAVVAGAMDDECGPVGVMHDRAGNASQH
jgi:hypothetical protein